MWIGVVWARELPYSGYVKVTVTGAQGSADSTCIGVEGYLVGSYNCVLGDDSLQITPGEELTLRGDALGVGDWTVTASTST